MTEVPAKEKTTAKAAKKEAAALSSLEVPAAFREFAERGVQQAKDVYDTYKSLAEDATDALEDTFTTMNKGLTDLQAKALGAAKANVNAGFDFVEQMLGVRSLAEAIELQTEFARRQFDSLSAQAKDFQALASKVQADAAKPFKDGVTKAMAQWKQAV